MNGDSLKELREEKAKLELAIAEEIVNFQNMFGVELRIISFEHTKGTGRRTPMKTDIVIDFKLT